MKVDEKLIKLLIENKIEDRNLDLEELKNIKALVEIANKYNFAHYLVLGMYKVDCIFCIAKLDKSLWLFYAVDDRRNIYEETLFYDCAITCLNIIEVNINKKDLSNAIKEFNYLKDSYSQEELESFANYWDYNISSLTKKR